jgi:hypothetical protein
MSRIPLFRAHLLTPDPVHVSHHNAVYQRQLMLKLVMQQCGVLHDLGLAVAGGLGTGFGDLMPVVL